MSVAPLHIHMCVNARIPLRRAATWHAFCHSFSKLHKNFNVTIYSIHHFMWHYDGLWFFNVQVKEEC